MLIPFARDLANVKYALVQRFTLPLNRVWLPAAVRKETDALLVSLLIVSIGKYGRAAQFARHRDPAVQ
jgi:hypothetical protein